MSFERPSTRTKKPVTKKKKINNATTNRDGSPKKLSQIRFDRDQKVTKGSGLGPVKRSQFKSSFGYLYSLGKIPCRISHGSVRHKLQWDADIEDIDYMLLVELAAGFAEIAHPFVFIVRRAWKELIEHKNAYEKVLYVTPHLIQPLRTSLASSSSADSFVAVCDAIVTLSNCIGPGLNPHIHVLIVQIKRKMFNAKYKDAVDRAISALGGNGGEEAQRLIKQKIPTYQFY